MSTDVTAPRASTCKRARTVPRSASTPRGKPGSTRLINLISRAAAGAGLAAAAGAAATVVDGVTAGGATAAAAGCTLGGAVAATVGAATTTGAVAVVVAGVGATVATAGAAAGAAVIGVTALFPGVAAAAAAGVGVGAALVAAVAGGAAGVGDVAVGETDGVIAAGPAAERGSLLSALSVGPVGVDGEAGAVLATAGSIDVFPLPPRNNHAEAATSARAATATPIIKGIRDGFSTTAAAGVALTCIRAVCTSSSGSAMLCASCETDAG